MDHLTPHSTTSSGESADTGAGVSIARQLTGELYCIECGYNLRGLSIRSNCSECGIPVRATILGIVDPHADELAPLYAPKISAVGLSAWSIGAMIAVVMVWVMHLLNFIGAQGGGWLSLLVPWGGIVGLAVSMMGGLTMIRPHAAVRPREAIRSAIAVAMYAPLLFVYHEMYFEQELPATASPVTGSMYRVLMFVFVAAIVYGLRPAAIGLAIRSVVVRTGRVDRQSLLAVLGALGIATLGDLLRLLTHLVSSASNDSISIISIVVIALGSMLFTLGMVNICLDSVRLFSVLVRPGVGLSDIFETNEQKSERTQEM